MASVAKQSRKQGGVAVKRMILAALALAPGMALAQNGGPPPAEIEAARKADAAMDKGRYLDAVEVLRPFANDADGKPAFGYGGQLYRQYAGWVSGGIPDPGKAERPLEPDEAKALAAAELRDAIAEIVDRARRTRIVMLNEDHGSPRSRAFALEVAKALRPLGYDILAAETLMNDADEAKSAAAMRRLAAEGYVRRETGFYSKDPTFAAFLRGALKLGYRPLAYEEMAEPSPTATRQQRFEHREESQADFLIARALKANPQAKLLVYVGFSHLAEAPLKDGDNKPARWMATRLKAKTGIDPLTIDQTAFLEDPTFSRSAGFRLIADRIAASPAPTRSVALFDGGKPLVVGQYAGAVDLQVVHPPTQLIDGRPDWLGAMGLKPVSIPAGLLPTSGRRLVQAFGATDAEDAVPMDQLVVTADHPAPPLMLPPGVAVRYATQDAGK